MAWVDTKNRNLDNVSEARLRQVIDLAFCEFHDSLEEAYYKNWKLGLSKDWFGYDKKATIQQSKDQFDLLHGMLWHLYAVCKSKYNKSLPINDRYDETKFNVAVTDESGNIILTKEAESINWLKTKLSNADKIKIRSLRDLLQTKLNFTFLTDVEIA